MRDVTMCRMYMELMYLIWMLHRQTCMHLYVYTNIDICTCTFVRACIPVRPSVYILWFMVYGAFRIFYGMVCRIMNCMVWCIVCCREWYMVGA